MKCYLNFRRCDHSPSITELVIFCADFFFFLRVEPAHHVCDVSPQQRQSWKKFHPRHHLPFGAFFALKKPLPSHPFRQLEIPPPPPPPPQLPAPVQQIQLLLSVNKYIFTTKRVTIPLLKILCHEVICCTLPDLFVRQSVFDSSRCRPMFLGLQYVVFNIF